MSTEEAVSEKDTDDVPREYDKIEVLFNIPEVGLVWWPTTVLSSREQKVPGLIKGTGKLEYANMHMYKKSCEEVQFLADRTLNSETGETSWRTSTEAADAGAGDSDDAEWNGRSENTRRVNATTTEVEGVQEGEGATRQFAQLEQREETPRKKARRLRKSSEVDRALPRYPEVSGSSHGGTAQSGVVQAETIDYLTRRISALEQAADDGPDRAIRQFKTNFVRDKADMWRVKLLSRLTERIKKPKATRVQYFGSLLRADCISISENFTFEWFSWVVDNIATSVATKLPRRVQFIPCLSDLVSAREEVAEGHVLFDDANTMLSWLGLGSGRDVKRQLSRWQTRNEEETARFLGGTQWGEDTRDKPLTCFIGRSCVRHVLQGKEQEGKALPAIQFSTARWDVSNNTFASPPSTATAFVGRLGDNDNFLSAFRISWRWRKEYNGRGVSTHGRRSGYSRVGEVTVYVPTITIRGENLTSSFKRLITDELLETTANCAE